ncbi:MAG: hypothetical protein HY537_15410 [Deltaproteobacteria bacterium]|nr:hypothetical protein [Deltaproteobacteria bacterium]
MKPRKSHKFLLATGILGMLLSSPSWAEDTIYEWVEGKVDEDVAASSDRTTAANPSPTEVTTQVEQSKESTTPTWFGFRTGFGGTFVKNSGTYEDIVGLNAIPIALRIESYFTEHATLGLDLGYLMGMATGVVSSNATAVKLTDKFSAFQITAMGRLYTNPAKIRGYGGFGLGIGFNDWTELTDSTGVTVGGAGTSFGPTLALGGTYDLTNGMRIFADLMYRWFIGSKYTWNDGKEYNITHQEFTLGGGAMMKF